MCEKISALIGCEFEVTLMGEVESEEDLEK